MDLRHYAHRYNFILRHSVFVYRIIFRDSDTFKFEKYTTNPFILAKSDRIYQQISIYQWFVKPTTESFVPNRQHLSFRIEKHVKEYKKKTKMQPSVNITSTRKKENGQKKIWVFECNSWMAMAMVRIPYVCVWNSSACSTAFPFAGRKKYIIKRQPPAMTWMYSLLFFFYLYYSQWAIRWSYEDEKK